MTINNYSQTADYIKSKIESVPDVAIVLGSGLGSLADYITDRIIIPYKEIPNFPISTAPGHKGNFICGVLNGKKIIAMQGRFHFYEGYSMQQVTFPIRVFAKLGVKTLIVTNAAGGVNLSYNTGDIMIIKDHICLSPNPLIGTNFDEFGPRFVDMSKPYDALLRKKVHEIADNLGIDVHEGVYLNLSGPSYETVSEVNYFRIIGADAVGMSTVPEVIVARHCNMRVFGMSVITNKATSANEDAIYDEQSVIIEADKATSKVVKIINKLIETI